MTLWWIGNAVLLVVVVPLLLESGPVAPLGSVGRKSHGTVDNVVSRLVGGPMNSETVRRPAMPAAAPLGTVNLITQAPFHAKPGSSGYAPV